MWVTCSLYAQVGFTHLTKLGKAISLAISSSLRLPKFALPMISSIVCIMERRVQLSPITWHHHNTQRIILRCIVGSYCCTQVLNWIRKWCTVCNDIASVLLPCATCRVGVCCMNNFTTIACAEWSVAIEKDNFIYYCPWCANGRDKPWKVCVGVFPCMHWPDA